ncbi:unnamed protein product [Calypogeia fissa]
MEDLGMESIATCLTRLGDVMPARPLCPPPESQQLQLTPSPPSSLRTYTLLPPLRFQCCKFLVDDASSDDLLRSRIRTFRSRECRGHLLLLLALGTIPAGPPPT